MSLVVVNASGPTTTTLPLISSVPGGTITIKDSGSASATNTITIVATAGNTFEIGTSYVLNTPLAYATFIGNPITLKWRVLGISNPDTPLFTSTIVNSNTGTIGGATATINTLTVSGIATLGNTSNTGNLGVGGITTLNTLGVTGNAAFSSLNAYNINFTSSITSNGLPFTSGISATSGFAQIVTGQMLLSSSRGMCFDPSGNMYVNSSDRGMIYKINPQGVMTLFAGICSLGLTIDGIGISASFTLIANMCYDSYTGCIVVATVGAVRLLNPVTAQVTTIAGNYSSTGVPTYGNTVGTGKAAQFQWVYGVCTDNAGNFYVTDYTYNNIKKVSISSPTPAADSGVVTMVAGSTSTTAANTTGYTNATGTSALFNGIQGITMNSSKTALYVVEYANNVVRQITLPGGVVTTVAGAGTGSTGVLSAGTAATTNSTTATSVQFNAPMGISIDSNNNLIVGEYAGNCVRYINLSPFYTLTLAGNGVGGHISGVGANARVSSAIAVSFDPYGNLWVLSFQGVIFQYNFQTGYLNLVYRGLASVPTPYALNNTALSTIATPVITTATLYASGNTITNSNSTNPGGATYTNPVALLMDPQNNLYVADQYKIRKISSSGVVTSIYGDPSNTQNTPQVGTSTKGTMSFVYGMCFDNSGNILFTQNLLSPTTFSIGSSAQLPSSVINRLNPNTGVLTTISLSTPLQTPKGIAYDGANTLYVVCTNVNTTAPLASYVVSININTGTVTTIAGSSSAAGDVDGAGASARFANLTGICIDKAKQNLFVCDFNNAKLKKIVISTSVVSTLFSINGPNFITMDAFSNLYIATDYTNFAIYKSEPPYSSVASWATGYTYPQGITVDSYNNVYLADSGTKVIYIMTPSNSGSYYSGVLNSTGSQDSTYASSITLMAPFVGINNPNPTSALHVNGNVSVSSNVNVSSNVIVSGIVNVTGSIITSGLSFSNGNSGATYNFATINSGIGYNRMTLTASTNGLGNYYLGINCNAPAEFLDVNGNAKVAGNITTTGNVVITGSLGTSTGGFYGKLSTEVWIHSTDNKPRLSYTNNSHSHYRTANGHLFRNINDTVIFTIDDNGSINASGNAVVTGTLVSTGGFYGRFGVNQWITSVDTVPRLYFSNNGDTFFYTAANSTFYFQSPAGNVANINGNSGTYTVMSDQRIKKNILITRDSLDIINQINIVSYDYIDSGRGSVKHGIVAQQLKQVYPDAVDTLRNVIPSHLTVVDFDLDASDNIIIKCSTPHELLVNDTVKLDIDNKRLDKVILEVPSDTTFIVSTWDNFSATSSVSLYGKYVNDFLSYDKSQIGILAAGACQTLSGQVSTLHSDSLTYSSTISTLQADSEVKASTITGLQSALDSQQSTITSILTKLST